MTVKVKVFISHICYSAFFLCPALFSSCALFRPLPLEPVANNDSVQVTGKPDLSKFNGDYEIFPEGSDCCSLDFAFTYLSKFDLKKRPGKNDYIRLSALDDRRIRATLFIDDREVKSKTVKGRAVNDYFLFHSSKFRFRFIFNTYGQQSNRITLSGQGNLYLDTNRGGIGFLLFLPIPLSGSSIVQYNLKFKRRDKNR